MAGGSDETGDDNIDRSRSSEIGKQSITNIESSRVATDLEKQKQDNFTSDVLKSLNSEAQSPSSSSLQIVDGNTVLLDSRRKPQDLLAQSHREPIQGSVSMDKIDLNVDPAGVAPFGGPLEPSVENSKIKTRFYHSLTIGISGFFNGVTADKDVLNINISDGLENGKIFDGKPHRFVAVINPYAGAMRHYKWIDATVQGDGEKSTLTIHRLSPRSERPVADSDWDLTDNRFARFPLRKSESPQYVNAEDYWKSVDGPPPPNSHSWIKNRRSLNINETVKD